MPDQKVVPSIPANSWWSLRNKLKSTPTIKVTASFLASLLSMEENSAKVNALPGFKQVKLIDDNGVPTELAMRWRDDNAYVEVCKEIRQACYPQEVIDLFPDNNANFDDVKRWFASNARVGEAAAAKRASFYMLLTEADVSKSSVSMGKKPAKTEPKPSSKPLVIDVPYVDSRKTDANAAASPADQASPRVVPELRKTNQPSLHIDVQIHISPETSAEQIDLIFASMAKHFQNLDENTK